MSNVSSNFTKKNKRAFRSTTAYLLTFFVPAMKTTTATITTLAWIKLHPVFSEELKNVPFDFFKSHLKATAGIIYAREDLDVFQISFSMLNYLLPYLLHTVSFAVTDSKVRCRWSED